MSILSRLLPLAVIVVLAVPAMAQEFPQVFAHKFGSTTIETKPERIVSLSYLGQDQFLALGVAPVGTREWYGDYAYGAWPWAVEALGDAKPEMLGEELNYEQIAALEPDVIEAVWSGITEEQYVALSKIAPVVATAAEYGDYGTPWQVITETVGRIVGQEAEAESLVSAIQARFTAIAAAHPQWQGKSNSIGWASEYLGVYRSNDTRSEMMTQLGFATPAAIDATSTPDNFYSELSFEQLPLLDTDVLIWFDGNDDATSVKALPLRDRLKAHAEGREIFAGKQLSGAFSYASPLSINYLLDTLVPEIELAVDGDPATVVPTAKAYGLLD